MAQAFAERKVKLALVAHPGIDLEGLRKSIADERGGSRCADL